MTSANILYPLTSSIKLITKEIWGKFQTEGMAVARVDERIELSNKTTRILYL